MFCFSSTQTSKPFLLTSVREKKKKNTHDEKSDDLVYDYRISNQFTSGSNSFRGFVFNNIKIEFG